MKDTHNTCTQPGKIHFPLCSVLQSRGKDAMKTDNDDLGHLTCGLELDKGRDMQELSSTTSMIAPDELAKKARKRSNKPHPGSIKVARTLAVVITLAFSQPDPKHSLFVWGVPLGSVSVFAKDGRLYTNHTHHSPSTVTLTFPTHSLVSFQNGLGCTLLQHTTSHALPTLPKPRQRQLVYGACIGTAQIGASLPPLHPVGPLD